MALYCRYVLLMKVRRVWFMNLNLAGYWHLGSQVTLLA